MGEQMQRKIDQWAGNQALTVLHRLLTLLLVPVLLAAAGMLLGHDSRLGLVEQRASEAERRVVVIELQLREAAIQASGVRADLAAQFAELQALRRQMERVERLLERRADPPGEGQTITR